MKEPCGLDRHRHLDRHALRFRKGDEQSIPLCCMGHPLMVNRNALIVDAAQTRASDTAEREAALLTGHAGAPREGAESHAGTRTGLWCARVRGCGPQPRRHPAHSRRQPHVQARHARIDPPRPARRTTRHRGYGARQRLPKCIGQGLGRIRTTGGLVQSRLRGLDRMDWKFTLTPPPTTWSGCPNCLPRHRANAPQPRNIRPDPPSLPQMANSSAAC